jgi:hypothetical protein
MRKQTFFATFLLSVVILTIYLWYASVGLWHGFPSESKYFDLQASAFLHGQIALEVTPAPEFIALEKEGILYEPSHREGIPVLWDASLYKGKYYIYWGPVPAVLLTGLKFFYAVEINDRVVTFLAGGLFFIFCAAFIFNLWKEHFKSTPVWAMLTSIAFTGLANPVLYILAEARVYEAAIMAGQTFLMGGLLWLYFGYKKTSPLYLALASTCFTLAIGSRTTLIPVVGTIFLILCVWIIKTKQKQFWLLLFSFTIPLFIGGALYAWYNFTRFGSITEFGLRYQLTSYNLYDKLDETFSPAYILPNTYKTLFNNLEQRVTFPYIFPTRWDGPAWIEAKIYPPFYLLLAESITGIFIATPFMIFAFFLKKKNNLQWILFSFIGAFAMAFMMMQGFFFTTMRYLLDFTPTLSILAVIGFWRVIESPKWGFILRPLSLLLFIYSISLSFILPLSGKIETYRAYNPDLLIQLTQLFNQLIP